MVMRPPELFLPAALNHVCHFWQLYIGPARRAICMHCRQAPRLRGEGLLHAWTNIHGTLGRVNTSRNTSNSVPCCCESSSAGMQLPLLISTHKQVNAGSLWSARRSARQGHLVANADIEAPPSHLCFSSPGTSTWSRRKGWGRGSTTSEDRWSW